MEHECLGRSSGKFLGETEFQKGSPVFPLGMFQTEISVRCIHVSSLILVPGL